MPKGTNQSDTHYCNNNLTRNAMFRGDYTTKPKISIPVNSFLYNTSIRDRTDITQSEWKREFTKFLPRKVIKL